MPAKLNYVSVVNLMKRHGGSMLWQPQGKGGTWMLRLEGRTLEVRIPAAPTRAAELNILDSLYVTKPGVQQPETWDDYDDLRLVDDAFWKLVEAFPKPQLARV